jgi:peptidoglycan/LPS O-acetylase OafA/YrhL
VNVKSVARIAELDGIRGLAIALVLVWHYLASRVDPQGASNQLLFVAKALVLTWSGVDLFFVLSGFLIGGILLDNRDSPTYFRTFYVRRIARILPLYFAWFLLFLLILRLGIFRSMPGLDHLFGAPLPLWSYATFTQNFVITATNDFGAEWLGITWSLAVEEQFYLVLPLLIYYVSLPRLPYVLLTGIALTPLLRIGIILWNPQFAQGAYVLMPARMDALFLGVLCAYLLRQPDVLTSLTKRRKQLTAAFVVLGIGVGWLTLITPARAVTIPLVSYGYTWLALFYTSFLLLAVTAAQSWPARIARLPFLRQLGFITYGVYLFHQGINGLFHGLLLQQEPQFHTPVDFGVTLLALAATIGLAYLSWHYFEKWIVRWGHSFQYR